MSTKHFIIAQPCSRVYYFGRSKVCLLRTLFKKLQPVTRLAVVDKSLFSLACCSRLYSDVTLDTENLRMKPFTAFWFFLALLTLLFVISFFLPETPLAVGALVCAAVVCGLVMFFWPLDSEKKRRGR